MLRVTESLLLSTVAVVALFACCLAEFSREDLQSRSDLKAMVNSLLADPNAAEYFMEKRGPMGFYGSRGKKALGFMGSRGKKALGFAGSRGKRAGEDDYLSYDDNSQNWEKRGPLGFAGSRGKRTPYKSYMLSRNRG